MKLTMNHKTRSKLQQQKDQVMNRLLLKIAAVVISTILVVYFLPRTGGFNYSYELNEPWHYGTMISTQKFNIQMSDSAMALKQDSLKRSFNPYFNHNSLIEQQVRKNVESLNCDVRLKSHVLALLDSVYERGVITGVDLDSLRDVGTSAIRVIKGNEAELVPIDRVYSMHEAYQYVTHHDEEAFPPTELVDLNLNTIMTPNLEYDPMKSAEELQSEYDAMVSNMGFVQVNEKIVDRGEVVTEEIYQKLKSYESIINSQQKSNVVVTSTLWGQVAIVAIIFILLVTYLTVFREDYLDKPRSIILLFALIVFFSIMSSLMVSHHFFHVFIIPCCMAPIITRVFLDSRTAFTFHVAMVLIISLSLTNPYEYILLQVIAGMVAVLNLRELMQRSQIVHTGIMVTVTYCLFYTGFQFAQGASFSDLDTRIFVYFIINGLLLLFAYPLLWIMEKAFGFVSDVTLVELSNINHPLLQKMSEEAPGTFQHSMQVANLASEVAKKIGAKPQLVRTGALYHDIGKIERPVFFTENQAGGNPHKHLSPTKSAEVIIAHVKNGLNLAEKYNLPEQIKGFIRTHHGLGKTKYFLVTYKNEHPDEEVDESLFQYPGPNPQTKEEAILMMADSVEAASRSLSEYTEESISKLVENIVETQVKEGYFRECPISFKDITEAKEVLKERLKIMYHTRISYPELNKVEK